MAKPIKQRHKNIKAHKKVSKLKEVKLVPKQSPKINFEVFREKYIPMKMPEREPQIAAIKKTIDDYLKNGVPRNRILLGRTGSGKTGTLRFVLRDYNPKQYVFVECKEFKSIRDVLAKIADITPEKREVATDLVPKIIHYLKKNPKIVVLDDLPVVPSWVEALSHIDGIFRECQSPIIVSTYLHNFLERLPDDARETLLFSRIDFEAYGAPQLYQIIRDRAKTAGAKVPETTMRYIAALATDSASARHALRMIEIAILDNAFDNASINKTQEELTEQKKSNYIWNMPPKERNILQFVLEKFDKAHNPVSTEQIIDFGKFSKGRCSQILKALELGDLISISKYGKEMKITPNLNLADKYRKGELTFEDKKNEARA